MLGFDAFELQLQTQLTETKQDFETALEIKNHEIFSLTEQIASERAERLLVESKLQASEQLAHKLSLDLRRADELLSTKEGEYLNLTDHVRALEKSIQQAREEKLKLETELEAEKVHCKRKISSLQREMKVPINKSQGKDKRKKFQR